MCQFIAHLYKCIPVTGGRSVPITQVYIIEDINGSLVDFIGNHYCQQVGVIRLNKSKNDVIGTGQAVKLNVLNDSYYRLELLKMQMVKEE